MTDSKQLVMHHLFLQGPRWRPSAQLRLSGEVFSSGMTQEKWNRDGKCGLVELGDQGSGWVGVTRLRSLSSMTNSANLTSELQQESMHNDVSATEGWTFLHRWLLNTRNSIGHNNLFNDNNRIHSILNLNLSGDSDQLTNSLCVKSFVRISIFWAKKGIIFSSSLSANPWKVCWPIGSWVMNGLVRLVTSHIFGIGYHEEESEIELLFSEYILWLPFRISFKSTEI